MLGEGVGPRSRPPSDVDQRDDGPARWFEHHAQGRGQQVEEPPRRVELVGRPGLAVLLLHGGCQDPTEPYGGQDPTTPYGGQRPSGEGCQCPSGEGCQLLAGQVAQDGLGEDGVVRAAEGVGPDVEGVGLDVEGVGLDVEGPDVVVISAEPVDEGGGRVGPLDTQAEGLEVVGVPPRSAADLEHGASWHGLGNPPEEGLERRARGPAGADVSLRGGPVGGRYLSEQSMAVRNPPAPTVLEPKTTTTDTTPTKEIAATA